MDWASLYVTSVAIPWPVRGGFLPCYGRPVLLVLWALVAMPELGSAPAIALSTSPRHVSKENDGRDSQGKTESFVFRLIVRGPDAACAEPRGATVQLRAGPRPIEERRYSSAALAGLRETPSRVSEDSEARYALRLAFTVPVEEKVDRGMYCDAK